MKNPGQYFEQMGIPPLAVPFNSYSHTNYTTQHPMQVQVSRPIRIPVAPRALSPVSLGYSTNCFGSYPYPGEFNSFPLTPIPVYHPDAANYDEHSQCRLYSPRDGFHWSYDVSPAEAEPSHEPAYINNNQAVQMPPGFHPDLSLYNDQQAFQAVDFSPVGDVADHKLTSSMPFGFGTGQSPRVMGYHEKYPMTNFPGKFPIVSPQPVTINNAEPEPPKFHPNQFSGQQAMQAQADFLPAADAADDKSTSPMPFGFGTANPPRVMVFPEKSPMANFLGKFPPGDYVMEIRVIPTNSDKNDSNSGSSVDEFEGDSVNGDEGKERMKLIIM